MDQGISQGAVALVVDGFSTGEFYPAALRAKGLRPVHVSSGVERGSPGLADYVAEALEHMRHDYDGFVDEAGNIDALAARLAPMAPCCVLPGCEMGVEAAELLAQRLGLPGNDPATSRTRRDKLAMHQALAAVGLPSLASLATADENEALAFAEGLGSWPVVLKPLRSAATEGVRFCRSASELRQAMQELLGTNTQFGEANAQVLVQQCAEGREFAVNTVSRGGRNALSDLWEYHKIPTPGGAPLYDRTRLVRELGPEHRAILAYAFQALDALGVRIGPAHTEVMLTPRGPVLIESGARPMGGSFPQELIREGLGHTQITWAVDSYVDAAAFESHAQEAYRPTHSMCMKSLISTREGELAGIPAIALAARMPSVRCGYFTSLISSWKVPRTVDLLTNPAHVFLFHKDEAVVQADWQLLRELETEAQNLLFELRLDDPMTETHTELSTVVPDEDWLKPEDAAVADAETIWRVLGLSVGARVLDCPCGDARVGVLLAAHGARITGVDLNERFIAKARERFDAAGLGPEQAQLHVADMRTLPGLDGFDAVLNWFNSFGYFSVAEDFGVLVGFATALRAGGRLLLEAPVREGLLDNIRHKCDADGTPLTGIRWDERTDRLVVRFSVPGPDGPREVCSGTHMYSLTQYRLLLRAAGMRLETVYGEGGTPFTPASRRMIMVAVKQSGSPKT